MSVSVITIAFGGLLIDIKEFTGGGDDNDKDDERIGGLVTISLSSFGGLKLKLKKILIIK